MKREETYQLDPWGGGAGRCQSELRIVRRSRFAMTKERENV